MNIIFSTLRCFALFVVCIRVALAASCQSFSTRFFGTNKFYSILPQTWFVLPPCVAAKEMEPGSKFHRCRRQIRCVPQAMYSGTQNALGEE